MLHPSLLLDTVHRVCGSVRAAAPCIASPCSPMAGTAQTGVMLACLHWVLQSGHVREREGSSPCIAQGATQPPAHGSLCTALPPERARSRLAECLGARQPGEERFARLRAVPWRGWHRRVRCLLALGSRDAAVHTVSHGPGCLPGEGEPLSPGDLCWGGGGFTFDTLRPQCDGYPARCGGNHLPAAVTATLTSDSQQAWSVWVATVWVTTVRVPTMCEGGGGSQHTPLTLLPPCTEKKRCPPLGCPKKPEGSPPSLLAKHCVFAWSQHVPGMCKHAIQHHRKGDA